MTATSDRPVGPVHGSWAVYPGTFDPFTRGHCDLVARARLMFDGVIVLVAVNADKQPTAGALVRSTQVRHAIPADWNNVEVDTWTGLTTAYACAAAPRSSSAACARPRTFATSTSSPR